MEKRDETLVNQSKQSGFGFDSLPFSKKGSEGLASLGAYIIAKKNPKNLK